MVMDTAAQWAASALFAGVTMSGAAAACWAHTVVLHAGLLPHNLYGRAQLLAATVAGALLGAGLAFGLALFARVALHLAQ
jgi:uncharacterized protein YfaA (DUF2138 family)